VKEHLCFHRVIELETWLLGNQRTHHDTVVILKVEVSLYKSVLEPNNKLNEFPVIY
jgi:hypothetical protein